MKDATRSRLRAALRTVLPIAFIGTMALVAAIVGSEPEPEPELITKATVAASRDFQGVLTKTVLSSKLRLVYTVGLEGAGHHFLDQVLLRMFADHDGVLLRIRDPVFMESFLVNRSITRKASNYFERSNRATTEMKALAKQAATLPAPGTIAKTKGRFSYPARTGARKVFQYIDVQVIAEKAEEEGIDFRVVYLQRSARDMIIANTVHRQFQDQLGDEGESTPEERFMDYMRILFTDAGVMHSLLAEIDPAFIICHKFTDMGDADQAGKVADFLSPTPEVADMLRAAFIVTASEHVSTHDPLPFKGAEELVRRLQRKLDVVEATVCGR